MRVGFGVRAGVGIGLGVRFGVMVRGKEECIAQWTKPLVVL